MIILPWHYSLRQGHSSMTIHSSFVINMLIGSFTHSMVSYVSWRGVFLEWMQTSSSLFKWMNERMNVFSELPWLKIWTFLNGLIYQGDGWERIFSCNTCLCFKEMIYSYLYWGAIYTELTLLTLHKRDT